MRETYSKLVLDKRMNDVVIENLLLTLSNVNCCSIFFTLDYFHYVQIFVIQ